MEELERKNITFIRVMYFKILKVNQCKTRLVSILYVMNYGPLGIHQKLLSKDVCKHGISFYNLYQYECFEEWQYISMLE